MKSLLLIFGLIAACRPDSDPAGTPAPAPSYQGDRIQATFPARNGLTPRQMFDRVIVPLMKRQGLGALVPAISVPSKGEIYQQRVSGIPIEHATLVATPTSVQGTLYRSYRITNERRLSAAAATPRNRVARSVDLVLYPSGTTSDSRVALRYTYRMLLADRADPSRTWMAWIDAESGTVVALAAQFDEE